MKRIILSLVVGAMATCLVACSNASSNSTGTQAADNENVVKENNDIIGDMAADLSTPVKKVIFNGDSDRTILALSNNNGLYGIGYGSYGEVYVFDEDNKSLLTDKYPDVDMSNVLEVVYDWGDLIYTTKDNKIVHTYYSEDENKYIMTECACTLGGVQDLFDALQAD